MKTIIINKPITLNQLKKIAKENFGDMVKVVVDLKRKIMAVGGELHADQEAVLLENGSRQKDLWGINLYPQKTGEDFIQFTSLINIRPADGNRDMVIQKKQVRRKIQRIVNKLIRG